MGTSPFILRNAQMLSRWKIINTFLCRWENDWNCLSHNYFCWSVQYLRSSLRYRWGTQYLSNKNGETRAGRTIRPIVRASKIVRWKWKYLLLQGDHRLKQNRGDLPLLAHLQGLYLFVKEYGLILSQKLIRISFTQCQNDWLFFFVMVIYFCSRRRWSDWILEIERWSSGRIWAPSMLVWWCMGRVQWQKAEETRKDLNIVLTHQDKKFSISELFKVVQDAIPLILHCRTMCWFRTISSSSFVTSDVQSVYTPSQIQDW